MNKEKRPEAKKHNLKDRIWETEWKERQKAMGMPSRLVYREAELERKKAILSWHDLFTSPICALDHFPGIPKR